MIISYKTLAANYDPKAAPAGFKEFTSKHGVPDPATCTVRLAYALHRTQLSFFADVEAPSGTEWRDLPTRADDLAAMLTKKIGRATRVTKPAEISNRTGIIFFDTIPGYRESARAAGTGHISLWDGGQVVDEGDYFTRSPRVYFWQLP